MLNFFTRVEIHGGGSANDYARLHALMELAGFSRLVYGGALRYHMPHAEYIFIGNSNVNALLQAAKNAVTSIGKTAAILVVQANGWTTDGFVRA